MINRIYNKLKKVILERRFNGKWETNTEKFSVIIPTIWKSDYIFDLVKRLNESENVGEIILIDNLGQNGKQLAKLNKVRVYSSDENLFVNPSWNLGVEMANYDLVAMANDDIIFEPDNVLKFAASKLSDKRVGIIGTHKSSINDHENSDLRLVYLDKRRTPFGVLMMFRKRDYIKIPESMKIWCGDNFMFWFMKGYHFALSGGQIRTVMSTSSGASQFDSIKQNDLKRFEEIIGENKSSKVFSSL